ncbi:RHS repeat domain-containing protein [Pseudoalteromonas piscicida]|uniref:RHS repeat domain-containing protein n=1 Tax=Pseudoalteromonas piscicida TaxID=43662 RepID=UPI0005FA0F56|nr:RHS repeat domain-containing protein [Pseudoalteromonas piscicida]KJZ02922.1 hypothetical protein TW73_10670 [Pseudoalteromonas piscicida]
MKLRKCIFTLAVGMCATALPAAPINTEYQYDELGRLTKTLDTKNGVRSYEYDAAGNRKKSRLPMITAIHHRMHKTIALP